MAASVGASVAASVAASHSQLGEGRVPDAAGGMQVRRPGRHVLGGEQLVHEVGEVDGVELARALAERGGEHVGVRHPPGGQETKMVTVAVWGTCE